MNSNIYECAFFNKKLNLKFKISKGYVLVIGTDSNSSNNDDKDDENNQADENNHANINKNSDDESTYCQYCWNYTTKCPDIGSIVISVNNVETNGLDKDFQLALLRNPQRPLIIRFKNPTDETIHLAYTLKVSNNNNNNTNNTNNTNNERLKFSSFCSKYNHSSASLLRKNVDSIISDYLECDWISARLQKKCLPQETIISLYKYIESEMMKLELFDIKNLSDSCLDSLRDHIENFIFKRIYIYTKQIGPTPEEIAMDSKNINDSLDPDDAFEAEDIDHSMPSSLTPSASSWLPSTVTSSSSSSSSSSSTQPHSLILQSRSSVCSPLMMKLASLRFVTFENLGLKMKINYTKQSSDILLSREEWRICIKGLIRALSMDSPGQILNKLTLTLRMISHSLDAYMKFPDGINLEFCCPNCNRMNGNINNDTLIINQFSKLDSNKSYEELDNLEYVIRIVKNDYENNQNQFAISADDFLPALTWTIIMANPSNIETSLWIAQEFRHPSLLHGEDAYCLSHVQSAVVWCKHVRSGYSFDMNEDEYIQHLIQYENSLQLILACKRGDIDSIQSYINKGADINCLTPDQRDCPLTACIRYNQKEALLQILQYNNIDVNLCLLYRKITPLMVAVQFSDVDIVLRLLKKGANRYMTDDNGNTALSMAIASNQDSIATILSTESKDINILECIRTDNEDKTLSGLLTTLFLQDISGVNKLYDDDTTTPLIEATKFLRVHIIKVLLTSGKADVNLKTIHGHTALYYCLKIVDENITFSNNVHNKIPDIIFICSILLKVGAALDDLSNSYIAKWKKNLDNMDNSSISQKIKQQIIQLFQSIGISTHCVDLVKENNINAIMNLILLGNNEKLNEVCLISNCTPLICCIIYENTVLFNLLIEANSINTIISLDQNQNVLIDINKRGARGLTALHYASQKGNVEYIGNLLRVGADRNIVGLEKNLKPLDIASMNNFHDAVNILTYNPTDSICLLAKEDNWVGVKSLLLQGVSINSRQRHTNENGSKIYELYSPLIAAVAYNRKDILKNILLVEGIDVNMPNQLGQTALMYASIQGNESMTLRLLKHGADRNCIDSCGKNAIYWAKLKNYDNIVSIINNDPKIVSIFDVICKGDLQSTIGLLKQGIDVNIKRNNYNKNDDNIAVPSTDGIHLETPLICASRYNKIDIVNLLLRSPDIKINDSDCKGWTALFHASNNNNEDIIISLIKKGATSTIYDINGDSIKNYKLL